MFYAIYLQVIVSMASSGNKLTEASKRFSTQGDTAQTFDKRQIQELEVLNSELKSAKKGARIYKQQPNSGVFFREDKLKVFSEAKKNLDDLQKEYITAAKPSEINQPVEEGGE